MKSSLIDVYFDMFKTYQDKYGKSTLLLMEVGSFFEAYNTLNEGPDLTTISSILNIVTTKKNKSISDVSRKNPYMMGFPNYTLQKYIKILIENNFTVITVTQGETNGKMIDRKFDRIYSPGTIENETSDNNYIMCLYVEKFIKKENITLGLSIIDVTTGDIIVHQMEPNMNDNNKNLNELITIMNVYTVKEIHFVYKDLNEEDLKIFRKTLENNDVLYHEFSEDKIKKMYLNIFDIAYQVSFLKSIYTNIKDVFIDLNIDDINHGRNAFVLLLRILYEYSNKTIFMSKIPLIYDDKKYLYMGNNSLYQLNVFTYDNTNSSGIYKNTSNIKSLFDVINYTSTAMGRRYLKNAIMKPIVNIEELNYRYSLINKYKHDYKPIEEILNLIGDLEKLNRKIYLKTINPSDLNIWMNYITNSSELLKKIGKLEYINNVEEKTLKELIEYMDLFFDKNELEKYNMNNIETNIFKKGKFPDLDDLESNMHDNKQIINLLSIGLNNFMKSKIKDNKNDEKMLFKITSNDKEGLYIMMSTNRANILKKEKTDGYIMIADKKIYIKEFEFADRQQGKVTKVTIPYLKHLSDNDDNKLKLFQETILCKYKKILNEISIKYMNYLTDLTNYIGYIDFVKSGAKLSSLNNYCCPEIKNKNEISFLKSEKIRHPIVEKINVYEEYIPFDIELGIDEKGILLFGLNSAGKSTFQKAIGINIILAQIGYHVAANNFEYYPFTKLFTRISSNDNIFKGQSSFMVEMSDLKAIIKNAGKNTLVIADEVCRGTEHNSSLIIVSSMIELLTQKNTTFITASHLHDICDLECVKNNKKIKIKHIEIHFDKVKNMLIYDRTLKDGNGNDFYGLNISQSLFSDDDFNALSNEIKNDIFKTKKSNYNSLLFKDKCQICGHKPNNTQVPLETHHIVFQKDSDKYGFLKEKQHLHKNHISNLCILCNICHDLVDKNLLIITGYENTSQGSYLIYSWALKS